jgi:hypothetical protein
LSVGYGSELLQALIKEFGEKPIISLDQVPCFYAKDIWELSAVSIRSNKLTAHRLLVSGASRSRSGILSRLPELNHVKGC